MHEMRMGPMEEHPVVRCDAGPVIEIVLCPTIDREAHVRRSGQSDCEVEGSEADSHRARRKHSAARHRHCGDPGGRRLCVTWFLSLCGRHTVRSAIGAAPYYYREGGKQRNHHQRDRCLECHIPVPSIPMNSPSVGLRSHSPWSRAQTAHVPLPIQTKQSLLTRGADPPPSRRTTYTEVFTPIGRGDCIC